MAATQNYKNHSRFLPPFHFFVLPILLANPICLFVWHWHHRNVYPHLLLWAIVVAVALLLLALFSRMMALKAQDRVIRLEERLRIAQLCSPAEQAELDSITMRQYIALRFASNTELPELARRAIRENLTEKQIKQAISAWRPDNDRV